MSDSPLFVLAVLASAVAVSEALVRRTFLRHLGTALLVILVVALAVNVGVIPAVGSGASEVYDALLGPVAQVAIFWMLLRVNLREVRRAGRSMILMFLAGSVGTFLGVMVGMAALGEGFAQHRQGLGAMFVGTYVGGSVNFNAMAQEYGVLREGGVYAAAAVVDSLLTTVWMAVTLIVPRWRRGQAAPEVGEAETLAEARDEEALDPFDVGLLIAAGGFAVWLSGHAGEALQVPSILVLTTVALAAAQVPWVGRLRGTRVLGMFAVYLFLAAIGALCDVGALRDAGALGGRLLAFAAIVLVVHGTVVFGVAALARVPAKIAAVSSQANVGGATSALALARSLGRADLVLPAILVGTLGSALGNYLGVLAASVLGT